MADNVISFENLVPQTKEASANYSKKMCENTECNKVKTATHTDDECWRKHPDFIPDKLKNKFNRRKNDYVKNHREGIWQVRRNPETLTKRLPRATSRKLKNF